MEFTDDFGSQTAAVNFVPTRPPEDITREFVRIYDVLYEPRAYAERTFNHFAKLPPQPNRKAFSPPRWSELRALAITGFRQLILSPARWTFLKLFVKALVKLPRRIPEYLTACVEAEHYFEYRRTISRRLNSPAGRNTAAVGD